MVIVVAEGAGQESVALGKLAADENDASGNRLLLDIDPTYMLQAIPSNAADNIYCSHLAHGAVHGAMAGFTVFTVGPVNNRHAYIPISRVTQAQNTVKLTDSMWVRLLASPNQLTFLHSSDNSQDRIDNEGNGLPNLNLETEEPTNQIMNPMNMASSC
ncbi:ATP-dependent 6-phosphofructokinase 4, chloroplastic-like [Mangifera indica]|uniref:ATP-dependent 6-phosphofructokinase 4, chloroplastic-like n=1 Tax=Mangifera indica TaxID=29780 RepID=UPI001CFBEBBB|nr:ATP-dependent 6-phosphofructokinase 4, chloroplastic-like [Mangifera indica]